MTKFLLFFVTLPALSQPLAPDSSFAKQAKQQAIRVYERAQAQPVSVPDTLIRRTALQKDTLRVIHRLFQARRQGASANVFAGLISAGTGIALVHLVSSIGTKPADGGRVAAASLKISLPGLTLAIVGIAKGIRFSRPKEDALALSYRQGQRLPEQVRRRLTRKFFR